jgi:hypothetical protein
MYIHVNGFEAWIFQNACRCHENRKITQFNTKVNNKLFEAYKFQSGRRCHGNYF